MKATSLKKKSYAPYFLINDVIISAVLTVIIDFEFKTFAIVFLMLTLNVFALPLAFIFPLPLWAWYVIVLTWLVEIWYLIKLEKGGENGDGEEA